FMDRLFHNYRHFVRAYIDDIIIFSRTAEEHLEYVGIVCDILDRARVHISGPKSFVAYPAVRLLGHVVNGEGVAKTDDRIAAFQKLKFPDTLNTLETYLGIARWLRKEIPWFDAKSRPLQARKTALLAAAREKGKLEPSKPKGARKAVTTSMRFEPTPEELESFRLLQEQLCNQSFLYHHRPQKPLFLKLDACRNGYAVFAFQLRGNWDDANPKIPGRDIPMSEIQPILFLSRATSNVEKRYGSTEAEVAALVWAVRKLRKMIQSNERPVNVLTDHAATKGVVKHTSLATMDLAKANLKLANAANYLSMFELNIFHIPGVLNVVPDALSRLPTWEQDDADLAENQADELGDIGVHLADGEVEDEFSADTTTATPVLSDEFRAMLLSKYPKDRRYS